MSWGNKIIEAIESRRDKQRKSLPGAIGDFWRNGGNNLLYDLPVKTGELIIDAGGYKGEWTAGMIVRYGCRSEIYEPVPAFANYCVQLFKNNGLVNVHEHALGCSNRTATFDIRDNGTSEFINGAVNGIKCKVVDIAEVLISLPQHTISCLKLNIEGGEYEVLERLIETRKITQCKSLLIQFHEQPQGFEKRYRRIAEELKSTHNQSWSFHFVWEKWELKK